MAETITKIDFQSFKTYKYTRGSSTNHVDSFLGVFDPPSPLVDKRGHFGNPPPCPCGFFNDPPPFGFISKKIFKVPIYWKFKIQTYYKLFVEYLVPNTFILHSSLIQYLQILEIKCKNVGIIIHMDRGLDPPSPHVDKHGHFGNPPSPLGCPHGL